MLNCLLYTINSQRLICAVYLCIINVYFCASAPSSSGSATSSNMATYLPPGAYVISQREGETIAVTAEMLHANTLATIRDADLSGHTAADVHAQLFIKDNKNCKISV